ncbi:MAG: hypothetical protein LM522_14460, partial [Candidatus Contendobacter sp.]|nr:hypothetical protein [Candidatus Contendobacter sp.]
IVAPPPRPAPSPEASSPTQPASEWRALIERLGLTGIAKQVALHCALAEREDNRFRLMLEPSHAQMLSDSVKERIRTALEQHLESPVTLKFQTGKVTATTPAQQQAEQQAERQQTAAEQIVRDPHVQAMQEMFDARIATIHPLDETDE